jgi:solute carrier family 50 protein (sugar transporter)
LQSPNFIGVPMGMLQLLLYCIYRRDHGAAAEAEVRVHGAAADEEKGLKAAVPMAVLVQPQETTDASK